MKSMPRIKICGITGLEDAFTAVDNGADALGFVFFAKSPRAVAPENARSIISSLPPFITTVGVFVDEDNDRIEQIISYTGLDAVQFHGTETPEKCKASRKVIKAIRVRDLSDLEPLKHYTSASAYLLDAYSPDSFGGTGQVFNWDIAVTAKNFGNIILAGGLTPDNIGDAVKFVRPYGVDVSSGVEGSTRGKKDPMKVKQFIEKARKAFQDHE